MAEAQPDAEARPANTAVVWLEAVGAAILFGGVASVVWAPARAVEAECPHPAWIGVLLVSAHYGHRGLVAALPTAAAVVFATWSAMDVDVASFVPRFESVPELVALLACAAVASTVSGHERARLLHRERLEALRRRAHDAETALEALRETVEALRDRTLKAGVSLTFLRDVAARLEHGDPIRAAEAAVELAVARTGAHAAFVEVEAAPGPRVLASRDANGRTGTDRDAVEFVVPIRWGRRRIGALALRGVPRAARRPATVQDLAVIAAWCGRALARAAEESAERDDARSEVA